MPTITRSDDKGIRVKITSNNKKKKVKNKRILKESVRKLKNR